MGRSPQCNKVKSAAFEEGDISDWDTVLSPKAIIKAPSLFDVNILCMQYAYIIAKTMSSDVWNLKREYGSGVIPRMLVLMLGRGPLNLQNTL